MIKSNVKYVFGFYNRKTQCFEDFSIFASINELADYYKALYTLFESKKYPDFEFANFILYPYDYSVFRFDSVHFAPVNPINALIPDFKEYGDFVDILGIKKESDDDVERDSDDYDSEPVYSSQSSRS